MWDSLETRFSYNYNKTELHEKLIASNTTKIEVLQRVVDDVIKHKASTPDGVVSEM